MFCPNCGEKLENPSQRFCASCGSEIQATLSLEISEAPQIPVEKTPAPPPTPPVPVYESKQIKPGGIGSHSKKCFAFSLVAIGFFVAGLSFGAGSIIRIFVPLYYFPYLPGGPGRWIIAFVLHVIGFIFGIVSRASSAKASRREASNGLQKVGSVFGVFGIVLNVIPLLIIPIAIAFNSMPSLYYDFLY